MQSVIIRLWGISLMLACVFLTPGAGVAVDTFHAELFLPDRAKFAPPWPGIIAIHEWWGLNDHVRAEARKLADEGFAVAAIDLYRGRLAKDADEAHELMRGLPTDRAMDDLKSAFGLLARNPDVWAERIGAIGWCMGGGYALELAAEEPRLAAAVIYYGKLITNDKRIAGIKASIYGFFGEADRGIPADSVREFEKKLKRLRPDAVNEIHLYPNAGHAFANATRPSYNDTAAKDAWSRTVRNLRCDLDGVVMRVTKRTDRSETCDLTLYAPGERVVYTVFAENDGNDVPDSVEFIDEMDTDVAIDLSSSGYGDVFTDSGMPNWGGRFNVTLEYLPRKAAKPRGARNPVYRPLTRKTRPADVGTVRWTIRFTGGDTTALGALFRGNPFLGPDNRNDDRRKLDGADTAYGAKADADAAYVRFAVRLNRR